MKTTSKLNNGILARASVLRKEVAAEAPKTKKCPKCKTAKNIEKHFGYRTHFPKAGTNMKVRVSVQSYCTDCRAGKKPVKVATKKVAKVLAKVQPKKKAIVAKPATSGGKKPAKKPAKKPTVKSEPASVPALQSLLSLDPQPVVAAVAETAPVAPAVTQAAPEAAPKAEVKPETKAEPVVKAVPPTVRRKSLVVDVQTGETEEQATARYNAPMAF